MPCWSCVKNACGALNHEHCGIIKHVWRVFLDDSCKSSTNCLTLCARRYRVCEAGRWLRRIQSTPAPSAMIAQSPEPSAPDTVWMLVSTALVLLMTPALAF